MGLIGEIRLALETIAADHRSKDGIALKVALKLYIVSQIVSQGGYRVDDAMASAEAMITQSMVEIQTNALQQKTP